MSSSNIRGSGFQSKSSVSSSGSQYRTTTSVVREQVVEYSSSNSMLSAAPKRFMGDDLEVTCFLMGIEIERLFEENLHYKSKIETLENQGLDRKRYDEHINELNDKLMGG
jgi:predicted aldo/keto reductase-like oxidoreductase